MNANRELSQKLKQQGTEVSPIKIFEDSMRSWWGGNGKKIEALCGSADMARKLFVTAVNVVQKTPKLLECDFNSFIRCLVNSAELNLFPGAMGECAYVPIKGKVELWPMYPGIVKHAFNGGVCKAISCNVVYEADLFDYEEGTNPFVKHKTFLGDPKDRGERVCFYGAVQTAHGEWQIRILPISFVEGIKSRAPGGKMSDSPWNNGDDNYDQMGRKTALKQAMKFIPKSAELARIIELDNSIERPDLAKHSIVDLSGLTGSVSGQSPAALPQNTGSSIEVPNQGREMEFAPAGQGSQSAEQRALYGDDSK